MKINIFFNLNYYIYICDMEKQRTYFTKKDMVDFGNYLLSEKRKQSFKVISTKNLKERLSKVHDADLANFREATQ